MKAGKPVLIFIILCCMLCLTPVFQGLSEGQSAQEDVLQYGDQGELVAGIQQRLSDLGYYSGKVSGNFLGGTQKAVKQFQSEYGLEVTGIVDGETEALLYSAEYRVLSHGCDGDDVARLQQRLITLGYLDAKATGKFRNATRTAVREFQSKNGLEATGTADLKLQKLLFSDHAVGKNAVPTPTPDPDTDPGDVNDIVVAGDGEKMVNSFGSTVTRGDKGQHIKDIQSRLKELGFFDGPISGNYMNKTIQAVKDFQAHNGLYADGLVGEDTWNMLFNTENVLDISCTPAPTPEPTPVPYAVTVDVRNQAVVVYTYDENGEYTIPVRKMVCSTGMKATPSDVGDWVLSGRKARWCYFPKWGSNAQYWTQINENIAFHSVIYNGVDTYVMSVKSYRKLGQRASHGCIRLLVSDARWVYENIGKGTVVTITESLPDNEELRKAVAAPPLNSSRTGPVKTPTPTAEPEYQSTAMPPQPFRQLQYSSSGEDVFWLQRKLQEMGYYTGAVTGTYYGATRKAVKAYQKDHGIYPSGKANVATLESIYADVIELNKAPAVTPQPEETPLPTVTLQPAETPAPQGE